MIRAAFFPLCCIALLATTSSALARDLYLTNATQHWTYIVDIRIMAPPGGVGTDCRNIRLSPGQKAECMVPNGIQSHTGVMAYIKATYIDIYSGYTVERLSCRLDQTIYRDFGSDHFRIEGPKGEPCKIKR
jgi:hypothetical protein